MLCGSTDRSSTSCSYPKDPSEVPRPRHRVHGQWLRENVETTWHSLGTCKMRPRDRGGVVGEGLGVYGVAGLKVADLSICPTNVGGHTNNTAMTIGEKAAGILVKELGWTDSP